MYEQFNLDARATLKPMLALVEINGRAMEKLVKQQASYAVDLIKSNVDHAQALAQSGDLESALETQQSYGKQLGEKFADSAQKQLDVILEAKDAMAGIFQSNLQPAPAKARPAAKPAAKKDAVAEG